MSVGSICTRVVHTVTRSESVAEAARRMREYGLGTLVVIDAQGRPVGMVTDRDIAIRCVAEDLGGETKVVTIMTEPVATIRETAPIDQAIRMMAGNSIRRLVVVDGAGDLVGIIALDDILDLLIEEAQDIGKLLNAQPIAT